MDDLLDTAGTTIVSKRAIVTGANGSMGMEICKALLDKGMHVIMTCKPGTLSDDFRDEMIGRYGEQVSFLLFDLASFDSIRKAAIEVISSGEPVDIIVNNAGMMGWTPQVAENGLEMHNMVNCYGPMLFTRLIAPAMHTGTRVVNTVSVAMWIGKISDEFPYPPRRFNRITRYSDSKLAFQLLSLRLAEEWQDKGITVNTSDPGIVDTPLIKLHSWVDKLTDIFFRPLIHTPRQGATTAIFLALDETVEGKSGRLYCNRKPKSLKNLSHHQAIPKLWNKLNDLLNDY